MEIILVSKSSEIHYTFPFNTHGYWEIILNLSGRGIATIDGCEYPFKEGTIFCIPPGISHRKIAENGFTDGCLFLKDFTPIDSRKIAWFEDNTNHSFLDLLSMAFDTQIKNVPNAKAIINAIGDVMYQLLISWSANESKRNHPVEAFQNVLLNNISNGDFNMASEIAKTGYCSSYFRKFFKEYAGCSPVSYLNHLRIEYSKKQMQMHHELFSIKEIALGSGFTDPYYFSRVFKQNEGISPQQYVRTLGSYNREQISYARKK